MEAKNIRANCICPARVHTEFVEDYEMVDCEDAVTGVTGDYAPTSNERGMIMDAIQGLIADDPILDKLVEAHKFTQAARREAHQCEHCGRDLPDHWGDCRDSPKDIKGD